MKPWLIIGAVVVAAVVIFFVMNRQKPAEEVSVPTTPAAPATAPAAADPQKAFLVENLKNEGWKETPSGLQYKVVTAATNPAAPKPAPGSEVTVNYEGRFIDGRVFDSSYKRGEPASFPLSQVIPGWTEGVAMMREGEKWEFAIPSKLGYGDSGGGPIPGGSTLLFTVELLKAKTPAP